MVYKIIAKNIKTNDSLVMGEVRGLEDVADTIKNVVFDEGDNVEEWSFEVSPVVDEQPTEARQRINELKERIKPLRCYDKLLGAIGECIYNFAEAHTEEFEATTNELTVVAEELVYSHTINNKELSERLMDEMELDARQWLNAEDSWDTTTVANAIMGIHEGYRCEQEEVPAWILEWAREHEDSNR